MVMFKFAAELPVGFEQYRRNSVKLFKTSAEFADHDVDELAAVSAEIIISGAISLIPTLSMVEKYDDQGPFYEEMCAMLHGMEEMSSSELFKDVLNSGTNIMQKLSRSLKDKGIRGAELVVEIKANDVAFMAEIVDEQNDEEEEDG